MTFILNICGSGDGDITDKFLINNESKRRYKANRREKGVICGYSVLAGPANLIVNTAVIR